MAGLGEALPAQALLVPQAVVGIASHLDERQELAIADQVLCGLEGSNVRLVLAVFVVPAVDRLIVLATEADTAGGNGDQGVFRRGARLPAGRPGGMRLDVVQRVLAHQDRRGLEMDALMLDSHQHPPSRTGFVSRSAR